MKTSTREKCHNCWIERKEDEITLLLFLYHNEPPRFPHILLPFMSLQHIQEMGCTESNISISFLLIQE